MLELFITPPSPISLGDDSSSSLWVFAGHNAMMVMVPMIIIEMEPAIMAFNLYEVITKVYFCGRMQSLDQCQFNSILLFISGEGLFMFTGRNCFAPGQLVVVGSSGRDGPRSSEKVCFFEFFVWQFIEMF